jgi:threonine dehydrogenase-like Zn-dependent dehydrogenase
MKQLTLVEPGRVEWVDAPEPALQGDGEAVVRPLAVALCDLDASIVTGQFPIPAPVALGHEFVAEVVDVGDSVNGVRPGERVVVPFQISCGECARCRRGQTGDCERVPRLSMYGFGTFGGDWGGALSDLVRVPYADAMLVALPEGLDPATVASASDNIPDAWRTVAPQLARRPGADVLVVGGGARSIGLYAVNMALALGAARVVYVDDDADRLRVGGELGAETVEGEPPHRLGPFPITVSASLTHEGLNCAIRSTEPGGICTCVAFVPEPATPMPLFEMYTNGLEFHTGRVMARPLIPEILERTAGGELHPERVTSKTVAWADAPDAVGEPETKLVVVNTGS